MSVGLFRARTISWALATLLFGAIGVYLVGTGAASLSTAHQAFGWRTVTGTIESSKLATRTSGRSNDLYADVRYSFQIDGRALRGDHVWACQCGTASETIKAVTELQEGSTHLVYVDPSDPSHSLLIPGYNLGMLSKMGFGALFFVFAALSGWTYRKKSSA